MNSLKTKIIDRRIVRSTIVQLQSLSSSKSVNNSDIQIPIRKERGSTDILQALESTVSRDLTAPDYKFIDDPYLIPTSLGKKRTYSLARESGKKAAEWILQEHAEYLKSNISEPLLEAFLPPEKYNDKNQVSEEILIKLIKLGRIFDVLHVYHLLEKNVSKQTKQAILEILCFYNSELNHISENYPEERSYQLQNEITKNVWKNNSEIEELFQELIIDETTAAGAYNALICGTAKYMNMDKAWQLYNECLEKKIPLTVTAYNYLIKLSPLLKVNTEERRVCIQSFLQNMATNGIKPNIGTLNSALKATSTIQAQGQAKDLALSLIVEFKSIGIEPSLASYYYLLLIFCRQNSPPSNILLEILNNLEKQKELKIVDATDNFFFVHAMEIASQHMQDVSAAQRLHKLLLTKDNYDFIGGRLKESIYYRNYLQLLLLNESIHDFVKIYDQLVPHIYIPEPALMHKILEALELNDPKIVMDLLPKFSSQIVMFDMLDRLQVLKRIFKLMTDHCTPPKNSPLIKQFTNFTNTLWNNYKEINEKRLQQTIWPAIIFGNMAVLFLRGNEFEKMLEVLDLLLKSQNLVIGSIHPNRLNEIFTACIERGHVIGAITALEYACEYAYCNTDCMHETLRKNLPLSPTQESYLDDILKSGKQKIKSNVSEK